MGTEKIAFYPALLSLSVVFFVSLEFFVIVNTSI